MEAVKPSDERALGTLTDRQIGALAGNGSLITHDYNPESIKQACYELRAGNIYYDLAEKAQRMVVEDGSYILVKPRQLIVIITMEKLDIPTDMLARILTKGKLFSIGLLPVNTYADPGFRGRLGIVFFNASTRYLKIAPGEPIAKIEFSRLATNVERGYDGQHGYETQIWPIPTGMVLSEEEIREDKRILSADRELELSYGRDFARVVKRISKFEKSILLASCLYFVLTFLILAMMSQGAVAPLGISAALGIIVNLATGLLIYRATDLSRR